MAEFVFTSPGVKFREKEITTVLKQVGLTTLGLVGETMKGPAFEPVAIQDKNQFRERFGTQNISRFNNGNLQYQLPYVANSYLNESDQLYVTRVLGLSGYDAGDQWAITLSAGVDPSTITTAAGSPTPNVAFSNNTYMGVSLYTVGDTGTSFTGFTKTNTTYNGTLESFIVTEIDATDSSKGKITVTPTVLSGTMYTEYDNMVLATIRSRGYVVDNINATPTTIFDAESLTISGNTTIIGSGNLFGQFSITASKGTSSETYGVSLDPNAANFLSNVIGTTPKDKKTKIWVESIYPDLIKKLDSFGDNFSVNPLLASTGLSGLSAFGFGVNSTLVKANTGVFTNYKTQFKTPETPWVVSQLKGSVVDQLFKFILISDGDSANEEIKISITNINPETFEFDVVIRDYYDTDGNPKVLEAFTRCTMFETESSYIGQRIGTSDGLYSLSSKYIMVEVADEIAVNVFPAGFEGYWLNNYKKEVTGFATDALSPKIFYKTKYEDNERKNRTYLGISESAYNTVNTTGTGINQNLFNFNGWRTGENNAAEGFVKSKGFHMDSGRSLEEEVNSVIVNNSQFAKEFELGNDQFQTITDINDPTNTYATAISRKFTFVPYGGFDGWNAHRTSRSYSDQFAKGKIYDGVDGNSAPLNDFQAWETAINTYSNPESITINLFATPGINWAHQNILVQDAVEMIETQRTDTLYIIDAPDVDIPIVIGSEKTVLVVANEIADLLKNAGIDSSYACTYYPWIQMRDAQNNVNIYLPPTGEVIAAMAYTDKVKFPWFAPAGLQRGVTNAIRSKYKLSLEARDVIYKGRINPLADFPDTGTAIFGQKTMLNNADSALTRINVRRLMLQIKVLISNIAVRLLFDQNDQATIDQFKSKVGPILDNIKRERGLVKFEIIMDDTLNTPTTLDRNELYGEINLIPTKALEFIGIGFTISPSGASFNETGTV